MSFYHSGFIPSGLGSVKVKDLTETWLSEKHNNPFIFSWNGNVSKGSWNGTLVILLPTVCRYSSEEHDICADSLLPSMYKGVAGRMSYDQKSCKVMKAVKLDKIMLDKSCITKL